SLYCKSLLSKCSEVVSYLHVIHLTSSWVTEPACQLSILLYSSPLCHITYGSYQLTTSFLINLLIDHYIYIDSIHHIQVVAGYSISSYHYILTDIQLSDSLITSTRHDITHILYDGIAYSEQLISRLTLCPY